MERQHARSGEVIFNSISSQFSFNTSVFALTLPGPWPEPVKISREIQNKYICSV